MLDWAAVKCPGVNSIQHECGVDGGCGAAYKFYMDVWVGTIRSCEKTRRILTVEVDGRRDDVYFDLLGETAPDAGIDGLLPMVIFRAMELNQPLRIHGAVQLDALINLSEYVAAWACLKPELYHRIELQPDTVTDARSSTSSTAMMAFSGGVDSIFSLLCQVSPNVLRPVDRAMFVALAGERSDGELMHLMDSYRAFLKPRGVDLQVLTTNIKQVFDQNVEDSYAARYVSCLHNYEHRTDFAYLASGESYREMVIPWGSSPSTDHLLSTPTMRLFLHGASYSRTEKASLIAQDREARSLVRVCTFRRDGNCGKCGKCVRTRMNFMASGVDPECMPGKFQLDQIDAIDIPHTAARRELESLLAYCEAHDVREPWVNRVRARISAPVPSKAMMRIQKFKKRLRLV